LHKVGTFQLPLVLYYRKAKCCVFPLIIKYYNALFGIVSSEIIHIHFPTLTPF